MNGYEYVAFGASAGLFVLGILIGGAAEKAMLRLRLRNRFYGRNDVEYAEIDYALDDESDGDRS